MSAENRLFAAKILAERNRDLLNTQLSPKEKELDELFYWILSMLEWNMNRLIPLKKYQSLNLIRDYGRYHYVDDELILAHERVARYYPKYVNGEEFYTVIKEVIQLFSEIENFKVMENELPGYPDFNALPYRTTIINISMGVE